LVDRDIDATGQSYRIYVTDLGDLALQRGRERIRGVRPQGSPWRSIDSGPGGARPR
jgi:hypothetical protein